jgi:UDP-glucose 4-epimerase
VSNDPIPRGRDAGSGQGSRTLVVGCGFIGSHIVEELARSSRPFAVLTRSCPPAAVANLIPGGHLYLGDAQSPELLERALQGVGHVVFSAGGLLPAQSEQDPGRDEELTLGPVRAILDALAARPGVAFTYLSSGGTVYGDPGEVPVGEDSPTNPIGVYGRLHVMAEGEVLAAREGGLDARILRCSTVYGEHQQPDRGQGAVVTFLHRIEAGEPIEIYGEGETVRDYVYAGDVATAIVALIDRPEAPPVLNLGSERPTPLNELRELVEKQVGKEAIVHRHPPRDFEVHRIVLDTSRLRGLIEFEPTPLEAGIARTHCWLATGTPEKV